MNYLECYTISREKVFAIANDYPKSRCVIRRFAMMMALKRKMLQLHEEKKKKTLEASAHDRMKILRKGSHNLLVFQSDQDAAETFDDLSAMHRAPIQAHSTDGAPSRASEVLGTSDAVDDMKAHVQETVKAQAEQLKGAQQDVKDMLQVNRQESREHMEALVAPLRAEQARQRAQLDEILSLLRSGGAVSAEGCMSTQQTPRHARSDARSEAKHEQRGAKHEAAASLVGISHEYAALCDRGSHAAPTEHRKGSHKSSRGHSHAHDTAGGHFFHLPQIPFLHASASSSSSSRAQAGDVKAIVTDPADSAATNGDATATVSLRSPDPASDAGSGRRRRSKKSSSEPGVPSTTEVDVHRV